MEPQQIDKFRTASCRHFRCTLKKDIVANYGSIWTLFPPSVRGLDVLYKKKLNVSYFDSQICGGNFQNAKKIGRRVVTNTSYGYY